MYIKTKLYFSKKYFTMNNMNQQESINKFSLHNFKVYADDFHKYEYQNQLKIKSLGWNGRELEIIPLYELMKLKIIPNGDLRNLKPFDIIYFDDNTAYFSYLIAPLKVKEKMKVELENTDDQFKQFLLSYGLIAFEFDCTGETSCIPPEGLEAIEKHGIHFFDTIIEEINDVEGIIVDYMYIKNNFDNLKNEATIIGEPYEYDKIAFLWLNNSHKLALNDASDEQLENMKNAQIIIPMKISKKEMNFVQLVDSLIKHLPDIRVDPYLHSFNLYEKKEMKANNTILPNKKEVRKDEEKKKLPNFKLMKKEELIQFIQVQNSKIEELEITLYHKTNDLNQITEQYKEIKSKTSNFERDSIYLKRNVDQGIDNMRQLLSKFENELDKIKPQYC